MLKADDNNRAQQEIHTTLTLTIQDDQLQEGDEINVGWAMNLATSDQIDEPTDLKVGTEAGELKDRISSYKGP